VTGGLGIGIDLLEIARLERALERRPRLGERDYAAAHARPGQHLAARFCAKEAVAKALGLEAWSWRDIEVVATDAAPLVALHGAVAARAAELGVEVRISLTHTGSEAAAVAIIAPV
jgi:holo-[acyl-carrier protein] synthase